MKMKSLMAATILSVATLTSTSLMAQTSHSMDHSSMNMDTDKMEGAIHAKAVVNSFSEGKVNVSHEPIPEIGWPEMTMDMPILPDAKIMESVSLGDSVTMMLVKGEDGIYGVQALMPE